jgi:hypothetical protein
MSYTIAYDAALAPARGPAIVAFMEDFYRTSDTESLHEKYLQSFTEDATLIMGPKEAKGAAGMFAFCNSPGGYLVRPAYGPYISTFCSPAYYYILHLVPCELRILTL